MNDQIRQDFEAWYATQEFEIPLMCPTMPSVYTFFAGCRFDAYVAGRQHADDQKERYRVALRNCRALANKCIRSDTEIDARHILRFCQEGGITGSLLREAEPQPEITPMPEEGWGA